MIRSSEVPVLDHVINAIADPDHVERAPAPVQAVEFMCTRYASCTPRRHMSIWPLLKGSNTADTVISTATFDFDISAMVLACPLTLTEVTIHDAPEINASALIAHALATYVLIGNVAFGLVYDTGAAENFIKDCSFMIADTMYEHRK